MTNLEWRKKLNGYFIAFCRKTFRWSPAYRNAVKGAEVSEHESVKYRCRSCKALVERSQKQVDHLEPVVPVGSPWSGSWDEYRDRTFVDVENLQVLCKTCHAGKTKKENAQRRKSCKSKMKSRRAK